MREGHEFLVGIQVMVIADGIDGTKGRLSLQVSPKSHPIDDELKVDIRHWPECIDALSRRICIVGARFASGDPANAPQLPPDWTVSVGAVAPKPNDPARHVGDATALWTRLFKNHEDAPDASFLALIKALPSATTPATPATPAAPAGGSVRRRLAEYSTAELGGFVDELYTIKLENSLRSSSPESPESKRYDVEFWRYFRRFLSPRNRRRVAVTSVARTTAFADAVASGTADPEEALRDRVQRTEALRSATAALRELLGSRQGETGALATVDSLAFGRRVGDPLLDEMDQFRDVWDIHEKRIPPPTEEEERCRLQEECDEIVRRAPLRKLRGILAFPTLAKYLGLLLDVEVDLKTLRGADPPIGRSYRALAARFPFAGICTGADSELQDAACVDFDGLRWTGAVLTLGSKHEYLGPCSKREAVARAPVSGDPFCDGIIDLTVNLDGSSGSTAGIPRFGATMMDVIDSTLGVIQTSVEVDDADTRGALPEDQSGRFPARGSRGIVVTDAAVKVEQIKKGTTRNAPPIVWFAEELLEGFRFDVATTHPRSRSWSDCSRWRSLVAREVGFPSSEGLPNVHPEFLATLGTRRERDDGVIRTVTGKTTHIDEGIPVETTKFIDELFTWTGESLAVPSMHHDVSSRDPRITHVDPRFDLGIPLTYDIPIGSDHDSHRCPPPLREGCDYTFGARACFLNGCGLTLDEAISQYIDPDKRIVLGDRNKDPLRFHRSREQNPPEVLLPWDDRIVWAKDPPWDIPGESVTTLVVRSGTKVTKSARRYLMPPRVDFEACERAGVFDDSNDPRPRGAFERSTRYDGDSKYGSFPLAADGGWIDAVVAGLVGSTDKPDSKRRSRESRGSVLVLNASAPLPEQRYYPDPHAPTVGARLLDAVYPSASTLACLTNAAPFWPKGRSFAEAVPIVLELRGASDLATGTRACFEEHKLHLFAPQYRGEQLLLPAISIALAPADEIELELWTHDPEPRVEHRLIVAAVKASPELREHISARLKTSSIPTVSGNKRLKLVHAVDRPLKAPAFAAIPTEIGDGRPGIRAVVITPRPASPGGAAAGSSTLRDWEGYAERRRNTDTDVMTWPSEEHGSMTFFVGAVEVDRSSTGSIRCTASWTEFEVAGVKWNPETSLWSFVPRPVPGDQLFAIDRISSKFDLRKRPVSLLTTDESPVEKPGQEKPKLEYRALAYSFPDGKARRLDLRLVANSRFSGFYPPETPAQERRRLESGVGKHDRASAAAQKLWVPATFRPRVPEIDRIMPVFHWEFGRDAAGAMMTWRRTASLRIYLARDSWYSTGEGEKLAVAFGPFKTASGEVLDFCGFERAVGPFREFITRWGADPIQISGELPPLMPLDGIRNGCVVTGPLRLPYGLVPVATAISPPQASYPAGTTLTVYGENFIRKATVTINCEDHEATVTSDSELTVTTKREFSAPLDVVVRNPDLLVTVKTFDVELDPVEGLWYVDLEIAPGASHSPFVQLGLARYQKHCAPHLELSPPVAAWAQVPPVREGKVTIGGDRRVVVEHHGVGFSRNCNPNSSVSGDDGPRLNLRLLRASTPGRVQPLSTGGVAWLPVVDQAGQPVTRLGLPPLRPGGNEARWAECIDLPPCKPGIRYGLSIEEIEYLNADPEPTEFPDHYTYPDGLAHVKSVRVERSPMFGHLVDLGE